MEEISDFEAGTSDTESVDADSLLGDVTDAESVQEEFSIENIIQQSESDTKILGSAEAEPDVESSDESDKSDDEQFDSSELPSKDTESETLSPILSDSHQESFRETKSENHSAKRSGSNLFITLDKKDYRTPDMLSLFEITEIISIRATQIAKYGSSLVESQNQDTDPIKLAKLEVSMRRVPFLLRREVGTVLDKKTGITTTYFEDWDVNTMKFPMNLISI